MSNFNPWHDVSIGNGAPEVVNCVVEIPCGERTKYELDKETGMIRLDRILSSAVHYPANYGFIPGTYCDDKDPLDALILSEAKILPNTLVDIRVIGLMSMVDGGEQDDKVIAVIDGDPLMEKVKDLSDLPQLKVDEIRVFFEDYKKLEKKEVEVTGFVGREEARKVIEESIQMYKDKFGA